MTRIRPSVASPAVSCPCCGTNVAATAPPLPSFFGGPAPATAERRVMLRNHAATGGNPRTCPGSGALVTVTRGRAGGPAGAPVG